MSVPLLEQVVAGRAPGLWPLTVDQYHQMFAAHILREGEPVELIDGILVRKDRSDAGGNPMSQGPRHALALKRLLRLMRPVEDFGHHLHAQLPVTLSAIQEPEPDLAIVRGSLEDYRDHHPGPADIAAAMEVADSSLEYDRTTKQALYAAANIPLYWIVNLAENRIEVYEQPDPSAKRYRLRHDYSSAQNVRLAIELPREITVLVADLVSA